MIYIFGHDNGADVHEVQRPHVQHDKLHFARNLQALDVEKPKTTATSGGLFHMHKVRTYSGPLIGVDLEESAKFPAQTEICQRWAVLTSVFEPTETVRQLEALEDWCVVVVGDKKGEVR